MAKYYFVVGSGNPQSFASYSPTFISFTNFDGTTQAPPGITQPVSNQGLFQFTFAAASLVAFIIDAGSSISATAGRYVFGTLSPDDAIGTTTIAIGATVVAIGGTITAIGTAQANMGTTLVVVGNTLTGVGTVLANTGSTLVAIGNTSITSAQGTGVTLIAQGATVIAIGTTLIAQGATLVAIGNTAITQANNIGTTLVAVGNTVAAIGSTIIFEGASLLGKIITVLGTTTTGYGGPASDPVDLWGKMSRIQEFLEGSQTYTKGSGSWLIQSRGGATTLATKTIAQSASLVTKS